MTPYERPFITLTATAKRKVRKKADTDFSLSAFELLAIRF